MTVGGAHGLYGDEAYLFTERVTQPVWMKANGVKLSVVVVAQTNGQFLGRQKELDFSTVKMVPYIFPFP